MKTFELNGYAYTVSTCECRYSNYGATLFVTPQDGLTWPEDNSRHFNTRRELRQWIQKMDNAKELARRKSFAFGL